jgi:hypothetical protein
MNLRTFVNSYIIENLDWFPKEEEIPTPIMPDVDAIFKEYVWNTLKNIKSKMKTLTIVVGNSNNYADYSVVSGKSEVV